MDDQSFFSSDSSDIEYLFTIPSNSQIFSNNDPAPTSNITSVTNQLSHSPSGSTSRPTGTQILSNRQSVNRSNHQISNLPQSTNSQSLNPGIQQVSSIPYLVNQVPTYYQANLVNQQKLPDYSIISPTSSLNSMLPLARFPLPQNYQIQANNSIMRQTNPISQSAISFSQLNPGMQAQYFQQMPQSFIPPNFNQISQPTNPTNFVQVAQISNPTNFTQIPNQNKVTQIPNQNNNVKIPNQNNFAQVTVHRKIYQTKKKSTSQNNQSQLSGNTNQSLSEDSSNSNLSEADSNEDLEINKKICVEALEAIQKHGIAGSRLFLSEYMQDIGRSLIIIAYSRSNSPYPSTYIRSFIPDFLERYSNSPFEELKDEKFVDSLFKKEELNILRKSAANDIHYRIALYVSNEKLPAKFQFVPEMSTFNGWTPLHDFIAITSLPFFDRPHDIICDERLPFKSLIGNETSKLEWLSKRLYLLLRELRIIIPPDFCVYEKTSTKKAIEFKKFGNIEHFISVNSHVLYPKRLSINFQKKILRLLYLYGIPLKDGIEKIQNILNYNDPNNNNSVLLFVTKILIKCIKYQPGLFDLLKTLPRVDEKLLNNDENVNINWIKDEALESVSSNIYIIYKVRENFSWFMNKSNIEIEEWKEIKDKYNWWSFKYDKILFKIVACYGFLFNSVSLLFIKKDSQDYNEIFKMRQQEIMELKPLTDHEKLNFLGPILNLETKKKRIIQILNSIQKVKSKT